MLINGPKWESAHADDGRAARTMHVESARAAAEEIAPDLKCASSFLADCRSHFHNILTANNKLHLL